MTNVNGIYSKFYAVYSFIRSNVLHANKTTKETGTEKTRDVK